MKLELDQRDTLRCLSSSTKILLFPYSQSFSYSMDFKVLLYFENLKVLNEIGENSKSFVFDLSNTVLLLPFVVWSDSECALWTPGTRSETMLDRQTRFTMKTRDFMLPQPHLIGIPEKIGLLRLRNVDLV